MNWLRKHVKLGARLALFALAAQFVLSFGHFHPAKAAPAPQATLAQADLAITAGLAAMDGTAGSAQKQSPSNHDNDQQPADPCSICAVISLANSVLFSTPPVLLLPQAVELFYLETETDFAHLNAAHPPFQSRAPPLS